MLFRVKPMVQSLAVALGGLGVVGTTAYAQQTPPAQAQQQLERITITGSNIRRTDTETVAPVDIITREQIERTGQPTVADVLRNIPSNTTSFTESFTNSFAPGAAGINLRGLGQRTTLVLINGRRMAGYGFAQNLTDSFVDLNAIPSAAVERIEILKDGASAVYGSDAIAGVVNIILRRDYQGVEATAGVGYFEGKNDYRASITGGFGDLGSNRFNLFGVLDFYKRDLVLMSDLDYAKNRDFRGEEGGRNSQSLTGGGTWRETSPTGGNSNFFRAISECSGEVLTPQQAIERGLISPVLGNTGFNQPGNTFCSRNFNNQFTSLPETDRIGFLGRGTFDLSPTTQLFTEVGLSRVESFQVFQSTFFAGTTALNPGNPPFSYNVRFAPGVAGNPFPTDARYAGVLNDMGTRDTDITSDTYRLLAGIRYSAFGWDLESAVGWNKNEVESLQLNGSSLSGTSAIFGVPTTPVPLNPISTSSTYNLDRPSQNSAAVRDQMRANYTRYGESELKFIDTKATREIGSLPGGPIGFAIGAEFRDESLSDTADPILLNGDVLGRGTTATNAERDILAVFTELSLPLTQQIEAQAALRYDDYSDYGNSLTPKVGIKFKPTPELLLRANWGRGFRAPSLVESSPSVATSFNTVQDPNFGGQLFTVSGVSLGNPGLQPEKSRSATVGFVWEPSSSFNISVDVYDITWSNIIGRDSIQDVVDAGGPDVMRDPVTGFISSVTRSFRNLTRTETRGVDIDARYIFRTNYGRFTPRLAVAYIAKFEEEDVEYVGTNGGSNTYPRWKGNVSLDWDQGPWAVTGRVNYIHHYYQSLLPGSWFTPQDPAFQTGTYPEKISSYTTLDLFARYNITANLAVTASILNVTGETPPYDPGFDPTGLYDFSLYDPRKQQYRLGVTYKFR